MKWKSHHLLDFGDSFGSDSDIARNPRCGQEFWPTSRESKRAMTQGLFPASWEKAKYPHDLPAAGNFKSDRLRPLSWKPDYPNPALLKMMLQDAYWGAKRVMSFSQAIPPPGNLVVCRGLSRLTDIHLGVLLVTHYVGN